jgi:zinc protease
MLPRLFRTVLPALVGALLAIAVPGWTQGAAAKPKVTKLSSGVTLIVEEAHEAPIVAIDIFVRAGSARETEKTAACAHMLEHVAFRGTEHRPGNAIDEAAEALGYELNANTQREVTHFYATCLSKDWKEVLGLLADAVQNPAPTEAAFSRERRVVMQELFARRDDPITLMEDRLFQLAYGDTGYGRSPAGSPDGIRSVSPDATLAFHKEWYTSGNTVIVLVGDLPAEEAQKHAELWFGGMRRGAAAPYEEPTPPKAGKTEEQGPYNQAAIALAYPAMGTERIEDSALLDVLVNLVEIRGGEEFQGDALAFSAQYLTLSRPSLVTAIAFATEAKLEQVTQNLESVLAKIYRGEFTESEFQSALDKTLGEELYQLETYYGRAYATGYWATLGGPGTMARYRQAINSASHEEAKRVAREVFDPGKELRLVWHARQGRGP